MLRLLGKDADPARSREHVMLSVLAKRRLQMGQSAELGALLEEVLTPPIERLGALEVDDFLALRERKNLAAGLHILLAAPTFATAARSILRPMSPGAQERGCLPGGERRPKGRVFGSEGPGRSAPASVDALTQGRRMLEFGDASRSVCRRSRRRDALIAHEACPEHGFGA